MIIFAHPHQDPGSTVLDVLQSLDVLARDPNEECITVVQSGGDTGMDELLCICLGESILTPRLVTDKVRGMFWPEKVILVMVEERS